MQLLQIMNLAGVLLFAKQPEWIVPQFVVIAIRYRRVTGQIAGLFGHLDPINDLLIQL